MESILYFKDNLRYLRKKMSVNQSFIAQKVGKTQKTVANWEGGVSEPNLQEILLLSNFFSISIDNLLSSNLAADIQEDNNFTAAISPLPPQELPPISLPSDNQHETVLLRELLSSRNETIGALQALIGSQREEMEMLKSHLLYLRKKQRFISVVKGH